MLNNWYISCSYWGFLFEIVKLSGVTHGGSNFYEDSDFKITPAQLGLAITKQNAMVVQHTL
jgi:hypothetical protein